MTEHDSNHGRPYIRFSLMIATSMAVMFILMYLHSYQLIDHAWFSETWLFRRSSWAAAWSS